MSVLLNGKFVEPSEIDPSKHKFIGMFRPAVNPMANPKCDILCTCGQMLRYKGLEIEHYKNGCYDINQYVDIIEESSQHQQVPNSELLI